MKLSAEMYIVLFLFFLQELFLIVNKKYKNIKYINIYDNTSNRGDFHVNNVI